jgi:hypothetical protein
MKVEDMNRLERAKRSMMRRMCGVTLSERIPIKELTHCLGIESISEVVTSGRLCWYGRVERKEDDDGVKVCAKLTVSGKSGRGIHGRNV